MDGISSRNYIALKSAVEDLGLSSFELNALIAQVVQDVQQQRLSQEELVGLVSLAGRVSRDFAKPEIARKIYESLISEGARFPLEYICFLQENLSDNHDYLRAKGYLDGSILIQTVEDAYQVWDLLHKEKLIRFFNPLLDLLQQFDFLFLLDQERSEKWCSIMCVMHLLQEIGPDEDLKKRCFSIQEEICSFLCQIEKPKKNKRFLEAVAIVGNGLAAQEKLDKLDLLIKECLRQIAGECLIDKIIKRERINLFIQGVLEGRRTFLAHCCDRLSLDLIEAIAPAVLDCNSEEERENRLLMLFGVVSQRDPKELFAFMSIMTDEDARFHFTRYVECFLRHSKLGTKGPELFWTLHQIPVERWQKVLQVAHALEEDQNLMSVGVLKLALYTVDLQQEAGNDEELKQRVFSLSQRMQNFLKREAVCEKFLSKFLVIVEDLRKEATLFQLCNEYEQFLARCEAIQEKTQISDLLESFLWKINVQVLCQGFSDEEKACIVQSCEGLSSQQIEMIAEWVVLLDSCRRRVRWMEIFRNLVRHEKQQEINALMAILSNKNKREQFSEDLEILLYSSLSGFSALNKVPIKQWSLIVELSRFLHVNILSSEYGLFLVKHFEGLALEERQLFMQAGSLFLDKIQEDDKVFLSYKQIQVPVCFFQEFGRIMSKVLFELKIQPALDDIEVFVVKVSELLRWEKYQESYALWSCDQKDLFFVILASFPGCDVKKLKEFLQKISVYEWADCTEILGKMLRALNDQPVYGKITNSDLYCLLKTIEPRQCREFLLNWELYFCQLVRANPLVSKPSLQILNAIPWEEKQQISLFVRFLCLQITDQNQNEVLRIILEFLQIPFQDKIALISIQNRMNYFSLNNLLKLRKQFRDWEEKCELFCDHFLFEEVVSVSFRRYLVESFFSYFIERRCEMDVLLSIKEFIKPSLLYIQEKDEPAAMVCCAQFFGYTKERLDLLKDFIPSQTEGVFRFYLAILASRIIIKGLAEKALAYKSLEKFSPRQLFAIYQNCMVSNSIDVQALLPWIDPDLDEFFSQEKEEGRINEIISYFYNEFEEKRVEISQFFITLVGREVKINQLEKLRFLINNPPLYGFTKEQVLNSIFIWLQDCRQEMPLSDVEQNNVVSFAISILQAQHLLCLESNHPVIIEAADVIALFCSDRPGERGNAYYVYAHQIRLLQEFQGPIEQTIHPVVFPGCRLPIKLRLQGLLDALRYVQSQKTYGQLQKWIGRVNQELSCIALDPNVFIRLLEAFETRIQTSSIRSWQESIVGMKRWLTHRDGFVHKLLHEPFGQPDAKAPELLQKLYEIAEYIIKQDSSSYDPNTGLCPQEDAVISLLSMIEECSTGQEAGIRVCHNAVLEKKRGQMLSEQESFIEEYLAIAIQKILDEALQSERLLQRLGALQGSAQGVHQAKYLRNLIGKECGLDCCMEMDPYEGTISRDLMQRSRQEILQVFFEEISVKIPFMVRRNINANLFQANGKGTPLYNHLARFFTEQGLENSLAWALDEQSNVELSEMGSFVLLRQMGYFE